MVVSFVKSNENTYPKGRALMQLNRVVPIRNRGNWLSILLLLYDSVYCDFYYWH